MSMSWLISLAAVIGGIIVAAIAVIGIAVYLIARGSAGRKPE